MINLSVPYLQGNEKKYLLECIKTNYVSTVGKFVDKFEKKFKKIYKFKYCCAVNSGTSALHLSLKSIGVGENDLVIMPSYTFAATANSAIYCHAEPWFFDIDNSLNLNLEQLERVLKKNTILKKNQSYHKKRKKRVAAMIVVFTLGSVPQIKKIKKILKKYKISLICDTAAAHFSTYNNNQLSKFNIDCCYSFNGNKSLTTGAGGIFATNNKRTFKKFFNFANIFKNKQGYGYDGVGYNYKMANINAAIGLAQLEQFNIIKKIKKKIYNKYNNEFKNLKNTNIIHFSNKNDFLPWVFAIESKSSSKIFKNLIENNINIKMFWKPLHLQKPYKKYLKENLSLCEKRWQNIITLPSSASLTLREQKKIIKIVSMIK